MLFWSCASSRGCGTLASMWLQCDAQQGVLSNKRCYSNSGPKKQLQLISQGQCCLSIMWWCHFPYGCITHWEWMSCVCRSLDAALVSPGFPTPFPNVRHMPDLAEGMSFNLANNIWGTNYIMWQPYSGVGDTMRFRFEISSKQQSSSRLGQLIGRASGLPSAVAAS